MSCAINDEVTVTPLLIGAAGLAKLLGVSTRSVWNMHASGTLGPLPVRLGARTLWRVSEIQMWTEAGCPMRDRWLDRKRVEKNLRSKADLC